MSEKVFVFIDESGSPDFFGKRKRPLWLDDNFSPCLIMGMVVTKHRKKLRKMVEAFQKKIKDDELYNSIPSVSKENWFFHGKDDHPEVRIQFIEFLRGIDFIDCYIVIARKIPEIFINKHNSNAKEFYFDVLKKMLEQYEFKGDGKYQLYLARRQSDSIKPFREAVQSVLDNIEKEIEGNEIDFNCELVYSKEFPELSVIDYLLWVIQRYIIKKERRYLGALEDKFKVILDIYDDESESNLYDKENSFRLEKAKPFGLEKK